MKYQRWHDQIIARARRRTLDAYSERHHIIPRCFGGPDDPDNLVDLTYREHFLVHWLMTRLFTGRPRMQMVYAVHCMTMQLGPRLVGGWRIEVAKRLLKRQALERLARRQAAVLAKRTAERDYRLSRVAILDEELRTFDPARRKDQLKLDNAANDWLRADPRQLAQVMREPIPKAMRKRRTPRIDKRTRDAIKRERQMAERSR